MMTTQLSLHWRMPQGVAVYNLIIQLALSMVAGESLKIYAAISDGTINFVDKFFEMRRHDAVRAFEIYRRASQQVKAKTIGEIHSKAEKSLGLRAGTAASIRNGSSGGNSGGLSPGGLPGTRPGTGGMMPRMPGVRKMPGMPGLDGDNWEVQRSKSSHKGYASRMQNPIASPSTLSYYPKVVVV